MAETLGRFTNSSRKQSLKDLRLVRTLAVIVLAALLVPYVLTPFYRSGHPVSTLMAWRWLKGAPVVRSWIDLGEMSQALPHAVVAAEDAHFCKHHGIDWGAVREVVSDAEDGEVTRGGSTITQQVAKNLFLWQGRSFVRKALEIPLAVWMNLVLPKSRVLELYLNIAEWGPNGEFGIEAGSRRAFNKSASQLTANEAALMAAILPNPKRRSAKLPRPAIRHIAGIVQARAAHYQAMDACLRRP